MTLDDAIAHACWVANNCEGECSEDHEQLAMWLCDLKRLRNIWDTVHDNTRAVVLENERLKAENDKLRSLAYKAWKAAEQLCLAFEGPCSGDSGFHGPCPMGERDGECIYGQLQRELRELGVEVDDG